MKSAIILFPGTNRERDMAAALKRATSPASIAVDAATQAAVLARQFARGQRRVFVTEHRQRDAGTAGIVQRDHRFGQVQ